MKSKHWMRDIFEQSPFCVSLAWRWYRARRVRIKAQQSIAALAW